MRDDFGVSLLIQQRNRSSQIANIPRLGSLIPSPLECGALTYCLDCTIAAGPGVKRRLVEPSRSVATDHRGNRRAAAGCRPSCPVTYGLKVSLNSRVDLHTVYALGFTNLTEWPMHNQNFISCACVCHKFNNVFKGHPRLPRCLMLSPALTQQSLPSLLAWLQQYGASVEIFAAYCGSPCVEAALGKLMPPQTSLDNVFLSDCSSSAVQLTSGLTSLTYCEIASPNDNIDLTPLKDLANLQKLHLTDGKFFASGLPAHLTNLTMEGADVYISQSTLGSSLRKLRVRDGQLSGLHPHGLLACSAVEHLQLDSCLIAADELEERVDFSADWFNPTDVCMPTGISALTSLSRLMLSLDLDGPGIAVFDLGPLHALTLLQNLFVQSDGLHMSLRASAELSALQKLTTLHLSVSGRAEYDPSDRQLPSYV